VTDSPIAAILGRIPSGIFVLTARDESQGVVRETGMLASWVMQAGFAPPMITAAVGNRRYLGDWLSKGSPFVLNLVAHEQTALLKHFGKGFEPDAPAFEGLQLARSPSGLPVLSEALGYLECAPRSHVDSGDHRIFLAEVTSATLFDAEVRPMVHLRKNGMHY
jgi:flavin reductase (DIM6/NTAB) family NADH-FMN oxidoreductase RutF